jgi:hypothetical protein
MYRMAATAYLLVLSFCLLTGTQVALAEGQKTEASKGITVEDLGRGLKSAAQNIEKEIPKAGSAIGNAFKTISSKASEKQSVESSSKEKK